MKVKLTTWPRSYLTDRICRDIRNEKSRIFVNAIWAGAVINVQKAAVYGHVDGDFDDKYARKTSQLQ